MGMGEERGEGRGGGGKSLMLCLFISFRCVVFDLSVWMESVWSQRRGRGVRSGYPFFFFFFFFFLLLFFGVLSPFRERFS